MNSHVSGELLQRMPSSQPARGNDTAAFHDPQRVRTVHINDRPRSSLTVPGLQNTYNQLHPQRSFDSNASQPVSHTYLAASPLMPQASSNQLQSIQYESPTMAFENTEHQRSMMSLCRLQTLDECEERWQERATGWQADLVRSEEKSNELASKNGKLEKMVIQLQTRNSRLEEQAHSAGSQLEATRAAHDDSRAACVELERQVVEKREEAARLATTLGIERTAWEAKTLAAEQQWKHRCAQLEEKLAAEVQRSEGEARRSTDSAGTIQRRYDELSAAHEAAKETLRELRGENDMLRKSAETLEHSLAAKAKDADRREREYEKAKRKEREKAAEKAKGLEKAMREQEREFREREASASPVVVDLVSRAEKAERTVADLAEEFKKVASATSLNNTMLTEHDMVERERTVWELEMRCSNLCDENTKLKDRVSDLQSAANRVLAERSVEEQELRATVRTLSSELQALQEMNQAHMRDTRRLKSTATELKSSAGGAAWLQAECEGLAREKAHQDGAIAALKQHLSEAEAERDAAKSAQKETERAFTRERDRRRELQDDLKAEQRDRGRDRQPARSPVPQPYAGVDGAGAGLAEKTVKSLREEADALETALRRARAEASEQRAAAAEAQRQKAEWKYKALMARPSAVTCTHCGARVTVWPLAQPALSSEAPPPRRPRCKHQKAMPEPYFQSENSD